MSVAHSNTFNYNMQQTYTQLYDNAKPLEQEVTFSICTRYFSPSKFSRSDFIIIFISSLEIKLVLRIPVVMGVYVYSTNLWKFFINKVFFFFLFSIKKKKSSTGRAILDKHSDLK